MIERFNFYDVFGFFIPGSLLLLLLWLPFGVLSRSSIPSDLSSTVLAVVVSYLVGHFLQSWANRAFPLAREGRNPSSRLLDPGNTRLGTKRDDLVRLLIAEFQLDVDAAANASPSEREKTDDTRDIAFLLARQRLIARKRVGYAEQFEGLYTMMRGTMAASLLGAVYLLGWAANVPLPFWIISVVLGVMVVVLCVAMALRLDERKLTTVERRVEHQARAQVVMAALLVAATVGGLALAQVNQPAGQARVVLLVAMAAAWMLGDPVRRQLRTLFARICASRLSWVRGSALGQGIET